MTFAVEEEEEEEEEEELEAIACRSILENTWGSARASYIGEMRNIGEGVVACGEAVLADGGGPYVAAYMRMGSCYGYTALTEADFVESDGTTLCLMTFAVEEEEVEEEEELEAIACRSILENTWGSARASYIGEMRNI